MKKTLLLSIVFLFGLWTFCPAQNNPIAADYLSSGSTGVGGNLNTGNPQVWSLMKYGGSTPNLYTGTVSASIPIYTYQDDDFTLPIGLSYASNGYMPNIQASDVGLGWYLNAGGCITRTVRGLPDDCYNDGLWGYMFHNQDFTNVSWDLWTKYINSKNGEIYSIKDGECSIETEPDIYTFNFPGHSGKFISTGGKVHVFDTNDPAGEYSVELYSIDSVSKNITIVTGDGYRYKFIAKKANPSLGTTDPETGDFTWTQLGNITPNPNQWTPGEKLPENWHLSTITAPNGRTVTFDYGTDLDGSNTTQYIETSRHGGRITIQKGWLEEDDWIFSYKERAVQIKSIDIAGLVNIRFTYGDRLPEKRHSIKENENEKLLDTPQKLETIVVTRKAQGNYAAADLKKCTLSYVYGIDSPGNPVMMLSSVKVFGEGTYKMEYYRQDRAFPFHGASGLDVWGYYNGGSKYGGGGYFWLPLLKYHYNFAQRMVNPAGVRNPNAEYAKQGMLTKMTYPTGGYTTYEYESHMFRNYLVRDCGSENWPYLKAYPKDTIAGGVRIRRITDHPITGDTVSRTYLYQVNGRSSGNLLDVPTPEYVIPRRPAGAAPPRRGQNLSGIVGYRTDQPHIEYSTVSEVYDDGSYVTYEFSNYSNAPYKFRTNPKVLVHPNIKLEIYTFERADSLKRHDDLPLLTNNALTEPDFEPQYRGKVLAVSYYDKADKNNAHFLRKKVEYEYETDALKFPRKYVESVKLAGDYFYVKRSYLQSFPLKTVTETEYSETTGFSGLKIQYSYSYNALGQIARVRRSESDGTGAVERVKYVSDLTSAEQKSGIYATMIAANILNLPLRAWKAIANGLINPNRPDMGENELRTAENQYEYIALTNNIIRLKSQKTARVDAPQELSVTPVFDEVLSNQYDAQGRLVQTTDRAGLTTSYVWGYNGLYPVAQVIGATYSTVKQAVGGTLPLSSYLSASQETSLRALSGVLVTTYQFAPHVGVTKVTDPSNRSQEFSYDTYGRLTGEKSQGYATRSYEYSVANQ